MDSRDLVNRICGWLDEDTQLGIVTTSVPPSGHSICIYGADGKRFILRVHENENTFGAGQASNTFAENDC